MVFKLPICCSPHAFRLLQRQVRVIDSPEALLNGSIAIASHQLIDLDASSVEATINGYAEVIRSRVKGSQPQALIAHLHEYLFDELGFSGNRDDYYNPLNSYLPSVLESKRGLPITLSLIYKLVAERLGLRAWGVPLPGHFVAAIEADGGTLMVDPFNNGREIEVEEAHARLEETFGPEVEWSEELLHPASNRHWLTRILQNLLNVFSTRGQYADVAAVLEMELLLWPEQRHLQRDLGLVLARCGMSQPATLWLDRYLQGNPDDPMKMQIEELLDVLSH